MARRGRTAGAPNRAYAANMPELVTPGLRWAADYRAALREAYERGEVVPWDPEHDGTDEAMEAAIGQMALGIWGPEATEPTQLLRWWVDGEEYLARISLRYLDLRETQPERYAGHGDIGYDVRPSARGRGVATDMLVAMLALARDRGYPDVLITCDTFNIASRRVLEKAGGTFIDEFDDAGELVLRYRFAL